jgi:hypothetical protein
VGGGNPAGRQLWYNNPMKDSDSYWLIGILEGEASFIQGPPSRPYCPYVCLQMSDEDVIGRVALLWGTTYFCKKSKNANHKDIFVTRIGNTKAYEFMKMIQPFMGSRRQAQIERSLACYQLKGKQSPIYDRAMMARLRSDGRSPVFCRRGGMHTHCA